MKRYKKIFKQYLDSVSKRQPSPGGGSVLSLLFCQGASLIEKAFNYSYILKPATQKDRDKNNKIKKNLVVVYALRKKIYPFIDKDAEVFGKIMKTKGARRLYFIAKSEALMGEVAKASLTVFSLVKKTESDIKKSIVSDFRIGKECLKIALMGSLENLKANQKLFGARGKSTRYLERELKKWQ